MKKNCPVCKSEITQEKGTRTCDMTGMQYEANIGKCDCDDIGGRMASFSEMPAVDLNPRNKGSVLPPHIQKKLDDLNELEDLSMSLGLHDKISSIRHAISKEIDELEKIQKAKQYVNFKHAGFGFN